MSFTEQGADYVSTMHRSFTEQGADLRFHDAS